MRAVFPSDRGHVEHALVVGGDEGNEPEVHERPDCDHPDHTREGSPVFRRVCHGLPFALDRLGFEPEHPRQLVEQHGGHNEGRHREEQGPWQPEEEDERRGQGGSEGEAGISAHGEEAHPARPARSGDVVGEPRRLGVERGHPDTAQNDAEQDQGIARRHADERHSAPGEQDTERHKGGYRPSVRKNAEQWLNDRRAHRRGEQEGAGRRQSDTPVRDQEGQQSSNGSLIEVREQVAGRQPRHRPPVDAFIWDLAQYRFLLM